MTDSGANCVLTVAICTYNRADWLCETIKSLRKQECPVPFEILVIDNNSKDHTGEVVAELAKRAGAPVRYVLEPRQGIVFARNRAIEECRSCLYMCFIDDDAIPLPGMLKAAVSALENDGADCVGGPVKVRFRGGVRPSWLGKDLLGFLGEVDHGELPFWITDSNHKFWTCNVVYRSSLFSGDLRFDFRYNREAQDIGGGEDDIMFDNLLSREIRIRYRPDMAVEHYVESRQYGRSYFLRRHYRSGRSVGYWRHSEYSRTFLGVPPFLCAQAARQWAKALKMLLLGQPQSAVLRQAMTGSYALGMIVGRFRRWIKRGQPERAM